MFIIIGAAKYAEIYAFLKKYAAPEPETKKKTEKEKKVKSKSKSTKTSSATSAKVEKTQEPCKMNELIIFFSRSYY